MRRRIRAVAAGVVFAALGVAVALQPGCSKSHAFEVRGVVRGSADGQPLAGVNVTADLGSIYHSTGLPATSAEDGSFAFTFGASSSQFPPDRLPTWTVTLSRDGFITEVVR